MNTEHAFSFSFEHREIERDASEQLCADNPLALEVAKPLFAAGLRIAAITERLNYHTTPPLNSPLRHVHTFTLHLQGKLSARLGDETRRLEPGQLAYTPPLTATERMGQEDDQVWFLYIELFDVPQWDGLKTRGSWVRQYEYADQMYLTLRRILDTHRTRQNIDLARANATLLVELLRHESTPATGAPSRQMAALKGLAEDISLRPEADWDTSEMARELNMSRARLTRMFQHEYSLPPKAFVIRQRIAQAMELLRETNHTIETIAPLIGYESPATFSNLFKKYTGMRPGAFRNNHAGS